MTVAPMRAVMPMFAQPYSLYAIRKSHTLRGMQAEWRKL